MNKLKLIIVEWGDAWSAGTWASDTDITDSYVTPAVIHSIGWLLRETKEGVYIASRIDSGNENHGNRCFIPKGMIRSRRYLSCKVPK